MEEKIPKTNRECFAMLDEMLSEEDKQYIIEKGTVVLHFGLGLWIRNNWIYPQNGRDIDKLMMTFTKHPPVYLDADNCSSIILIAYRKHLKRALKKKNYGKTE